MKYKLIRDIKYAIQSKLYIAKKYFETFDLKNTVFTNNYNDRWPS